MNLDPKTCSACGGRCCKHMPGAAFPNDFNLPSLEQLTQALNSGKWAIDWWEGDARPDHTELSETYFVRPATKGNENKLFDPSWGGECIFLSPTGCELLAEQRPRGCRDLKPDPIAFVCLPQNASDKQDATIAWIPYHSFLENFNQKETS